MHPNKSDHYHHTRKKSKYEDAYVIIDGFSQQDKDETSGKAQRYHGM